MPLWTPKDASRPLWTQGRHPPSYTRRRLLPASFAVDYHKNRERQGQGVKGSHQRVHQFPGGGIPHGDGCGRGVGLGSTPGRGGRRYRVTLRPRLPTPCRVERPVSAGAGCSVGGWRQAAGQRPTPLLAPSPVPDSGFPWRPLHTNGGGQLDDGPTLPLCSSDFRHVALSETFEGGWPSNPDSLSDVFPGGEAEQQREVYFFPYLQLHPPHCDSCTC
jgi:hypothetical protein